MNKGISQGFGMVLNIMHIAAILAVVMIATIGQSTLIAIGAGIGYLFVVGLACTLIAIREHLETLIEIARKPAAKPAVIRRREPAL